MNILWLCDIDGTLVNITPVHLKTYKKLYKDIGGVDISDNLLLPHFGMSEFQMHKTIFKKIGLNNNLIKKMITAHPKYFSNELSAQKIQSLPGVNEFLREVSRRKEHCGIVTGNLLENANLILKKAGLLFDFIATDDGTKVRWEIVKDAITAARKKGYVWDKVVIIGDTITDIEAARECAKKTNENITDIAVATGTCTFAELKDADLRLNGFDKKIFSFVKKDNVK